MENRSLSYICKATGKPCNWIWEDFFDDFGEVEASELVCEHCGRYKSSIIGEDSPTQND